MEDVSESEVFEQANGGHGKQTAFWVVYLNQEEISRSLKYNLHHMTQNKLYSAIINKNLLGEIYRQNTALAREIDEWHDNNIL